MSSQRIVVLGYVVRGPIGGMAWHHLQYFLGLIDLGHDVYFLEDSDDYPSCYSPETHQLGTDATYGLRFAADVFERVGAPDRWGYFDAHRKTWEGPLGAASERFASSADVLLNVSGINPLRSWSERVPLRVLIDTDPAFSQIRHLTKEDSRLLAAGHNAFFSFGANIGTVSNTVPDDGYPWRPTRQPVHLPSWRVSHGDADGPITTVMQWRSYQPLEYEGRRYGLKEHSFAPYLDLPAESGERFELALGGESAPRGMLSEHGWALVDPLQVSRSPWSYRRFIEASKAEFSVAKAGYVVSNSGWFSERSANYLASARPVIVQDTGFATWMHSSDGVLPFRTVEEAVEAIGVLNDGYQKRCRAARDVAEEYFDSAKVLTRLIEDAYEPGGEAATSRPTPETDMPGSS